MDKDPLIASQQHHMVKTLLEAVLLVDYRLYVDHSQWLSLISGTGCYQDFKLSAALLCRGYPQKPFLKKCPPSTRLAIPFLLQPSMLFQLNGGKVCLCLSSAFVTHCCIWVHDLTFWSCSEGMDQDGLRLCYRVDPIIPAGILQSSHPLFTCREPGRYSRSALSSLANRGHGRLNCPTFLPWMTKQCRQKSCMPERTKSAGHCRSVSNEPSPRPHRFRLVDPWAQT